ncbi:MAG: hypothetical protein V3U54_02185 [Thermodesulfobacteriota bacterium]
MKKFVESGGAFMVVALLCITSGLISENGPIFIGVGGFWLIMAIIVRGKYEKKKPHENDS